MKKSQKVVFYICLTVFVVCIAILGYQKYQDYKNDNIGEKYTKATVSEAKKANELQDNPIDFKKLIKENSDIYSWIVIDGTNINYPILNPNGKSNGYYLRKNIEEEYDKNGVIYTENYNKTDWSDPVTLVYGHNIWTADKMFHQLHKFEDESFFKNHDTFKIYAPGRALTYEIYSAFEYDDRHIMNSFNFSKQEVFQEFIDTTLNPKSLVKNVRDGVNITTDDKIVVLSTCIQNKENQRYLVVGVLRKDEKTK